MDSVCNQKESMSRTVLGLRTDLIWGLIGVLFFIVGDGLEQAWISPYLVEKGMSMQETATLIAIYGIAVMIGAWFSGVLVEAWGPRKTMLIGAIAWTIGQLAFLLVALPHMSFWIMLPTYCIRGLGYPLFCYSYLVWVTYRNPQKTLGTAVGWFYLAFTGGLYIVSNIYASLMLPIIGGVGLLWSALVWVIIGSLIVLFTVKGRMETTTNDFKEQLKIMIKGITIVKHNRKVGVGGIVRMINGLSQFALPVFLPTYLIIHGFPLEQWLQIWATAFTVNIAFNLIWGVVGDKIGWRKTIQIFGAIGTAIALVLLAEAPEYLKGNFIGMLWIGGIYGAFLAGFCPLNALVPSLEKKHKGAAMSILNLGSGMASFVGPAIVACFFGLVGAKGVLYIFVFIYLFSIILIQYLKLPEESDKI